MPQRFIDLSYPVNESTPPWPGTPAVTIDILDRATLTTPEQRHVNSSRLGLNIHCGTHMDAPFHFLPDGRTIDQVSLEQTIGPATLIDLGERGPGTRIERSDLEPFAELLRKTRKGILKTGWSRRWMRPEFFHQFPDITPDAARFLVELDVELIGTETPSVDYPPNPTHVVLLGAGMLIVENLTNLDRITAREFRFAAIPLKLDGRDGSPVRAIAILDDE